jgi:hypothetical protein
MILYHYDVSMALSSKVGSGKVNAQNGNESFTLFLYIFSLPELTVALDFPCTPSRSDSKQLRPSTKDGLGNNSKGGAATLREHCTTHMEV